MTPIGFIPATYRTITEGVKLVANEPYMLQDQETVWVHAEDNKHWYFNTVTKEIRERRDE